MTKEVPNTGELEFRLCYIFVTILLQDTVNVEAEHGILEEEMPCESHHFKVPCYTFGGYLSCC